MGKYNNIFKNTVDHLVRDSKNNIWVNLNEISKLCVNEGKRIRPGIFNNINIKKLNDIIDYKPVGNKKITVKSNSNYINQSGIDELSIFKDNKIFKHYNKWLSDNFNKIEKVVGKPTLIKIDKNINIKCNNINSEKCNKKSANESINIELLKKHIALNSLYKKKDFIYIVSTNSDYNKSIFKVGRTINMNSRISSYNSGHTEKMLCFYKQSVYNGQEIENILSNILQNFKTENDDGKKSREMYNINLSDLVQYLNIIIKNQVEIYDKYNKNFFKLIENVENVVDINMVKKINNNKNNK